MPAPALERREATHTAVTLTPPERRLGFWSAASVVVIDVLYLTTGIAWLVRAGANSPEPLQPEQPYLAILEFLLLLSIPPLVTLMAAIHAYAAPEHKTLGLAALAFTCMFAVVTMGVHFARLVVLRQAPPEAVPEIAVVRLYPWPSVALALDLLAWDLLLGLALLSAAPVFRAGRLPTAVRIAMTLCGVLCVTGFLGPALGVMQLQYLAIAGYTVGLMITCTLLAALFHQATPDPSAFQR
jgi:hypothetical protein